jgi:hypothetical protein
MISKGAVTYCYTSPLAPSRSNSPSDVPKVDLSRFPNKSHTLSNLGPNQNPMFLVQTTISCCYSRTPKPHTMAERYYSLQSSRPSRPHRPVSQVPSEPLAPLPGQYNEQGAITHIVRQDSSPDLKKSASSRTAFWKQSKHFTASRHNVKLDVKRKLCIVFLVVTAFIILFALILRIFVRQNKNSGIVTISVNIPLMVANQS